MKTNCTKAACCTFFLFIVSITTYSQDNWSWLNPKPMGSSIESCGYFPGTNTVIAVGANGLIMRSTDNGTNWSHINSNLSSKLNSVSIINSSTAYVAGDDITLIKTTDAGVTWMAVSTTGISGSIAQIQFLDVFSGFARIANAVYFTSDGGSNWIDILVSTTNGDLKCINAISSNELYVGTTTGYVFRCQGPYPGTNTVSLACSTPVVSIKQFDGKLIAVASDQQIRYSTDDGSNWTNCTGSFTGLSFTEADVVTNDMMVAFTSSGQIVNTSNGTSWSTVSAVTSNDLKTASGNLSGKGVILGGSGNQYSTVDGGVNWTRVSSTTTTNHLNSIFTLDGITIWAAGNNRTVIKSTDGGNSWVQKTSTAAEVINDIKFVSPLIGYFVAGSKIYKSNDGGESWSVIKTLSGTLYEISATDPDNIIIAASGKTIYYTIDGGSVWNSKVVGTTGNHYSVYYLNSTTAYSAGSTGRIYKTADNGANWPTSGSASGTINSIWFSTSDIGWAVGFKDSSGNPGEILKTTNGGTTWNLVPNFYTVTLQSVRFSDANNGIIVGNNGVIYKTVDGGETWTTSAQVTANTLMSAALLNSSTTLVAGNTGTIIKSSNAPLPVELTSFTASVRNNVVNLNWETATEVDNYGFEIERKDKHSNWTKIGFVEGHFTSNSPKYYTFSDKPSGSSKFSYRLKQIDNDGKFEYSGIVEVDLSGMLPKDIEIKNFPNPFNPETNINIKLPETGQTTVELYNSTGEKIFTIYKGKLDVGTTLSLKVDGSTLPSGVYLIRVSAGKYRKTHKILLMK